MKESPGPTASLLGLMAGTWLGVATQVRAERLRYRKPLSLHFGRVGPPAQPVGSFAFLCLVVWV